MIFGFNYRVWLGLIVLAFVVGVYVMGRTDGKTIEIGKSNTEKQETINDSIDIREKQGQVARSSSDESYINSLRGETF
jgi:hypothetical protein